MQNFSLDLSGSLNQPTDMDRILSIIPEVFYLGTSFLDLRTMDPGLKDNRNDERECPSISMNCRFQRRFAALRSDCESLLPNDAKVTKKSLRWHWAPISNTLFIGLIAAPIFLPP